MMKKGKKSWVQKGKVQNFDKKIQSGWKFGLNKVKRDQISVQNNMWT